MTTGLHIDRATWFVYPGRITGFLADRISTLCGSGYLKFIGHHGAAHAYRVAGDIDQYLDAGDKLLQHYGADPLTERKH